MILKKNLGIRCYHLTVSKKTTNPVRLGQGATLSTLVNLCHVNLNSLSNKVNEVHSLLQKENIDLIAISETWLTEETVDATVAIPGYNLTRVDNPGLVKKHGVAMYIKCSLKFEVISCSLNYLNVYLNDFNLYVIVVYRPPSYSVQDNEALSSYLIENCRDREIVMLGDFNLPTLHWGSETMLDRYMDPCDRKFFELFSELGLIQIIEAGTHHPSEHVLDLILVSDEDRIGDWSVLEPLSRCCHSPIMTTYILQRDILANEEMEDEQMKL